MLNLTEASSMRAVVAVVIFALISSSSACERHTCPPGPVYLYFQYENCTGTIQYDRVYYGTLDECRPNNGDSSISHIYSTHMEYLEYYGVEDCGGGRADAIVSRGSRTYFGVCNTEITKPTKSEQRYPAYMLLANVNDSFVSPQEKFVDYDIPTYPKVALSPCESEADCKSKGSFFNQRFANDTCLVEDASLEVNAAVKPYKCYRDGETGQYLTLGCHGPHTLEINTFNDNACTRLLSTNFDGDKCGPNRGSTTFHCTAVKPTVVNNASSASFFTPVVMFLFVMAALAILIQ